MDRPETWEIFFGDVFFKNGKNGTFRRVPEGEPFREEDIKSISACLAKFRELYTTNKLNTDEGLPSLGDTKVSHFGYTCTILRENCNLLKNGTYNEVDHEIKQYLEDSNYQEFVDALLDKFILQAQEMTPKEVGPLTEKERQEDKRDQAAAREDFLKILNNLEDVRRQAVKEAGLASKTALLAEKMAKDASESAESAIESAESASKSAESILPNILTTLGIFVAIIVAVVACYLSLLLSRHFENAHPLNIAICILMGHILTNVVCLLLYLISKMTNFTLACNCPIGNKMDCGCCSPEKQETCTWANKIWLKYPYVVLLNGAFCLAYVGLGLWNIFRRYLGGKIDGLLFRDPLLVFAIILLIVLAFFIFTRALIGALRWKSHGDEAKKTVIQKLQFFFSVTARFFLRCVGGLLRCLTAPARRVWTDLVRIVEKRIDARQKEGELQRKIEELETRIGKLEGNALTEIETD